MKDVVSKPMNWMLAINVRNDIASIKGHKNFSKARLEVLSKFKDLFPTLDIDLTEDPDEADKARDKEKPAATMTLTRPQWNAVLVGFQARLQSEESEGAKAGILRSAKILRMKEECLKALPASEAGQAKADDEDEPLPDSE